ncbi:MAG: hypothetical protein WBC21_01160 [Minisyncoccales bacterium]
MEYIIEFDTGKNIRFTGFHFFKNISEFCNLCYFIFKGEKSFILLDINYGYDIDDRFLLKQIVSAEVDVLANIISWEYEVAMRESRIYLNDFKNIKSFPSKEPEDAKFIYKGLFTSKLTEENLSILSGFRQMKNEVSRPLKYLMCYRLLEVFAKYHENNVDKFIINNRIKTKFMKDPRNSKNTKTLITHFRNKIHPTKTTYIFPSSLLSAHLEEIERVVSLIIGDIIKIK